MFAVLMLGPAVGGVWLILEMIFPTILMQHIWGLYNGVNLTDALLLAILIFFRPDFTIFKSFFSLLIFIINLANSGQL